MDTTRFKPRGAFMGGYVLIPERFYDDLRLLSMLLQESYEYLLGFPPK